MNQKIPLLLAACLIGLTGCSTYSAKMEYQAEMEALCQKDGGAKIYETTVLANEYFSANGSVKPQKTYRKGEWLNTIIADRYELQLSQEDLKYSSKALVRLIKQDRRLVDLFTGRVLAKSRDYCRIGGDTIALHPTTSCCLKAGESIELAFVKAEK